MIVDAHCHTFVTSMRIPAFPVDRLLAAMDGAGVERAVLLQGPYYGDCNDYLSFVSREHPDRLVCMAYLDPWSEPRPEALPAGAFRGVKLECSVPTGLLGMHPDARLDDPALEWLWAALDRARLVLTLDLGGPGTASYQTEAVRGIAVAHPGLTIVIAHLGQPSPAALRDSGLRGQWEAQLSLGLLPNVWFDTAALPSYYRREPYPWPGAADVLKRASERIGAGKLLWGTDIPGLLQYGEYARLREHVERALAALPGPQRERVFGGNARRIYFEDR